jgi:hypothetical protein
VAAAWRIRRHGGSTFCYVLPGDEAFNGADEVTRPVGWLKTASAAQLALVGAEACTFTDARPDDRLHRAIFHEFDGLTISHVAEPDTFDEARQKMLDWLKPYADAGSEAAKHMVFQLGIADCFEDIADIAKKSHVLVM